MRSAPVVLVGSVLLGTLVACSSGPAPDTSGPSAPSGTAGVPPTARVPAALVAAFLVMYGAKLDIGGVPVTSVEDDGGVASSDGLSTQAVLRVATSGDLVTLVLQTLSDPAAARSAYASSGSTGMTPVTGVGDAASLGPSGFDVLDGSQVLSVRAELGPAGVAAETKAKLAGRTPPASLYASLSRETTAIGRAAAGRLDGRGVDPQSVADGYVPATGVDPCTTPVSDLESDGVTVERQRVMSDSSPALECLYQFSGPAAPIPSLAVYTLTALQAVTAATPTTPDAYFTKIRTSYVGGGTSFTSGVVADPVKTQARTTPDEPDYSLDVDNAFTMDLTPVGGQKAVPKDCQPFGTVTGDLARILAPRLKYQLDRYSGETKEPDPDNDPNEVEDWLNLWRRELDEDLGPQVQQSPTSADDFVSLLDKAQRTAAKPWSCEEWNSILRLSR